LAIGCCPDQKAQKRLNAILLLLCGGSIELTIAHAGVSIRCLQLWIRHFNQSGIDGITYRPRSGRPRLMGAEEIGEKILPVVDNPQEADRNKWIKQREELFQEVRLLLNDTETVRSVSAFKLG
jgi:transposase